MRKPSLFLALAIGVLFVVTASALVHSVVSAAQAHATPVPSQAAVAPAQPAYLGNSPHAGRPGIYVFYDWEHLSPTDYPLVGGHITIKWNQIQTADGVYSWDYLDAWIAAEAIETKWAMNLNAMSV